jgi:hypothetical protein
VRCASAKARVSASELGAFPILSKKLFVRGPKACGVKEKLLKDARAQQGNGRQETTELFREIKEDGSGFTKRYGLVSGDVAICTLALAFMAMKSADFCSPFRGFTGIRR